MEKFAIGLLIGGLSGALLTANNYKMRTLVKKGQEEVQAKIDKLMDEKIEALDKSANDVKEEIKEKTEEVKNEVKDVVKKKSRPSRKKEATAEA